MKAMIFAAGLGSRLGKHTRNTPKALVEVRGRTLLELAILQLKKHGFQEIIINVHHYAGQIIRYLSDHSNFNCSITISDEQDQLLETGGGLKKAAWFFEDGPPFLVYNVDILTDLDLRHVYDAHVESGALATLATRDRESSRKLLFNPEGYLAGWQNVQTGELRLSRKNEKSLLPLAFSGIHVINPPIFSLIRQEGKFSIIETYLDLAKNHKIKSYRHDDSLWLDVGKPEELEQAGRILGLWE